MRPGFCSREVVFVHSSKVSVSGTILACSLVMKMTKSVKQHTFQNTGPFAEGVRWLDSTSDLVMETI